MKFLPPLTALLALALASSADAQTRITSNGIGQITNLLPVSIAPSGSLPNTSASELFNPIGLNILAPSDTAASTATPGTNIPTLATVEETFGGSAVNDGRNALSSHLHMTSATSPTNTYRYYAGLNVIADAANNDGGVSGTPQGYLYGVGGRYAAQVRVDFLGRNIPGRL